MKSGRGASVDTSLLWALHGACQELDSMQITMSSPDGSKWTRNKVKSPSQMPSRTREMSGALRWPFRRLLGVTMMTFIRFRA